MQRHVVVSATLRRLAACMAIAFALVAGTESLAQNPPPPAPTRQAQAPQTPPAPTPLPQEQFDALVKAITASVLEKLKTQGDAKAKPADEKARRFDAAQAREPDAVARFVEQTSQVIQAGVPALMTAILDFARLLDNADRGGRGYAGFLLLLLASAAAAVSLEALLHRAARPLQARFASTAPASFGRRSFASLAALALIDAAGVVAVWLACRIAIRLWFGGSTGQDAFGAAFLFAIFYWRLYVLGFRLVVRPELPTARLCAMSDADAARMLRTTSALVLVAAVLRALSVGLAEANATPDAVAAVRVLIAPVLLAILLAFAVRVRNGARSWLAGLAHVAPWMGFVGRHWTPAAGAIFATLVGTQVYGAVSKHLNAPNTVLLTLNLLVGLLAFETLLQAAVRRLDSQLEGFSPAGGRPRLPDVIARCARVFALIVVSAFVAQSWVVDVLGLVDERAWDVLTDVAYSTGATLFAAFVLWELFKYAADSYMERVVRKTLGAGEDGSAASSVAARFDTLMPILRITVATVIVIVATLVALDELGVNTAPLLAGASVLGLAISFGSQALVKDIVSGVFYLADDAFRVGEYIRCGQSEGTVESFTLRSIRLRHRNGQIHVIPFGDLGQIANFSRDWAVIKFNLRFARDTDLDKLRDATAAVAADLSAAPDIKHEILEPLRIHSVAEVADNALVVRFRLKVRPTGSRTVQDRALRHMLATLPGLGVAFAA